MTTYRKRWRLLGLAVGLVIALALSVPASLLQVLLLLVLIVGLLVAGDRLGALVEHRRAEGRGLVRVDRGGHLHSIRRQRAA